MKRFLLLSLLLVLAACQPPAPTPYPSPQPTQELPTPTPAATATASPTTTPLPYPIPARPDATPTAPAFIANTYTFYPYFSTQAIRPKLGLAAGGIAEWPDTPQLLGLDWGAPSHQWGPYEANPADYYGLYRYPMLWGVTAVELERATRTLPTYRGVILPFNECDLPDQCGREFCVFLPGGPNRWDCSQAPRIAAVAMVAAMDALPAALWITPSFSDADRWCVSLSAWWREFRAAGGDESRIVGMGYHRYTAGNDSFVETLDKCYETLARNGAPLLPVWVTEIGLWWDCSAAGAGKFGVFLEEALNDSRVVVAMVYAPRATFPFCALAGVDGLTDYGRAVRDAGRPGAVGNGYP